MNSNFMTSLASSNHLLSNGIDLERLAYALDRIGWDWEDAFMRSCEVRTHELCRNVSFREIPNLSLSFHSLELGNDNFFSSSYHILCTLQPSLLKLDPECVRARKEEGPGGGARVPRRVPRGDDAVLAEHRDEGDLGLVHGEPPPQAHPRPASKAQKGAPKNR